MNEIGSLETVTIGGTGNSRKVRDSQPESTTQYTQFDWFRTQANKLPSKVKETVFVLCVDEFQGLQNPRQSLCEFLHQGDLGLKIVPVYFGLSDAPDVLQRANVIRLLTANSIALGSLSAEASKAILLAFWEGLKIDFSSTSSRDRVIAEAAARCDRWPHHLVSWMLAACEVLPAHSFTMTTEALSQTNENCTRYRREYYSDRVRGPAALSSESCGQAFGELLHSRSVVDEDEINLALGSALAKVRRDFDVKQFIAEAIHYGVLERAGIGKYRVPIPSLADYIYEDSKPLG